MRIPYRSCARSSRHGEVVYEQSGPVEFCCEGMCRRWGTLLGFWAKGHAQSTSREVNLWLDRPQAGGKTLLELVPVEFCPWCGMAVEVCRVK